MSQEGSSAAKFLYNVRFQNTQLDTVPPASMNSSPVDNDNHGLSEEQLRAGTYSMLAALLRYPPSADGLARLQGAGESEDKGEGEDVRAAAAQDTLAGAWIALKRTAENTDPAALDDEYHALFIGVGRGELIPYGSHYLTGFLMEKPLGDLRTDLDRLGYARQAHVREPEDHAAALCEVMAMLVLDDEIPLDEQRRFFETHVGSWMGSFFLDLEKAKAADFYRALGRLASEFIRLEKTYLSMLV